MNGKSSKIILLLAGFALVVAGLAALFGHFTVPVGGTVRGTGEMVSRPIQTEDFTAINISGFYHVTYRQARSSSITVEMQENLFEYLQISVENGTLIVDSRRTFRTNGANTPRLYIDAPFLEGIRIAGAVSTGDWDTINAERFSISVAGASEMTIPMEVERLDVRIAGGASLTLSGEVDTAELSAAGAADVSAGRLQTRDADISITGAGSVTIAASDNLNVSIAGAGSVRYIGDPAVTQSILGAGSVERAS